MRNVLVTGGAGFIGSNFVRHLLRDMPGVRVVNLDALTYAGSRENLLSVPDDGRHHLVHGDINDGALVGRLMHDHAIDTLVHFAAETHVDRSILGPAPFIRTNILGTFNLLEAARAEWHTPSGWAEGVRFHHVSTDEVYGSLAPGAPAFREDSPYAPNSPYAASKAAADHLVRAYAHTYGLPMTISNCSNNYGPYQFPEKLLPLMLLNGLTGKPLPIYGDGRQVRDWLYVEDHCRAIRQVVERGRLGETYNIGGGVQPTNLEVVEHLCRLLDEAGPMSPHAPHRRLMSFVADRPGHDRRYAMDTRKIEAELGWKPAETLASGLEKTVAWYLENMDWVSAIQGDPNYQDWMADNYARRGETT